MLETNVIGCCMQRHRHQEFTRLLNAIEAALLAGKVIHIILDNYGSHMRPKVQAWFGRHLRFVLHYRPKSTDLRQAKGVGHAERDAGNAD